MLPALILFSSAKYAKVYKYTEYYTRQNSILFGKVPDYPKTRSNTNFR